MTRLLAPALALLLVGCGTTSPQPPPSPAPAPSPSPATPPPSAPAPAPASTRPDPPEPTAPEVECRFERQVFCQPGTPTLTALQPSPFEWCARTAAARADGGVGPRVTPQFSAAETRAHRAGDPDACCYVEFVARLCR